MGMSVANIIGSLAGEHGYRIITDRKTTAGKVYLGIAKSGTKKSESRWFIGCWDNSDSLISDFEWAGGEGIRERNKCWNKRADGTYDYQED